jgi:hypothetical protein
MMRRCSASIRPELTPRVKRTAARPATNRDTVPSTGTSAPSAKRNTPAKGLFGSGLRGERNEPKAPFG